MGRVFFNNPDEVERLAQQVKQKEQEQQSRNGMDE